MKLVNTSLLKLWGRKVFNLQHLVLAKRNNDKLLHIVNSQTCNQMFVTWRCIDAFEVEDVRKGVKAEYTADESSPSLMGNKYN